MLNKLNRCISFLMAISMILSLMPVTALSTEEDHHSETTPVTEETSAVVVTEETSVTIAAEELLTMSTEGTVATIPVEEASAAIVTEEETIATEPAYSNNLLLQQLQSKIDDILIYYLGTTTISQEEIYLIVDGMDYDTYQTARYELYELEYSEEALSLSDDERDFLVDSNLVLTIFSDTLDEKARNSNEVQMFGSYSHTPVAGVSVSVSTDNGTSSMDTAGAITITTKGGTFLSKTSTATITNTAGETVTLKFKYKPSGTYSEFKVAGTSKSGEGEYSGEIAAGGTVTVSIKSSSGKSSNVVLSGFSAKVKVASSNVTVSYNSLGSVTADGTAVTSGGTVTVGESGATFVATPESGASFIGWMETSTHKILSTSATYVMDSTGDVAMEAVFVNSSSAPHFSVSSTYLYDNLPDAITKAGSSGTIALMNSATLPVGNYIIPSGVTLLIPYDNAATLIAANMDAFTSSSTTLPTTDNLYRQLTMTSGTSITVNGGLCVGAQSSRQMVGQVGPYGAIVMDSGSSITVANGGKLYAYGYIMHGANGGGTVTVASGGTVYENMTVRDYPGSAGTTQDLYSDSKIFPVRGYTVRNVEVPMTLYSGAEEYVFYCLYSGTLSRNFAGYVLFVSDDNTAPFQLNAGTTMTKSYANGIQHVSFNGDVALNSIALTIQMVPISSTDTSGFPIPSGYDITASGTLTLNDNLILTEGSKVTVTAGTTVNANGKNIYVLDATEDKGANSSTDLYGNAYTVVNEDAVLDINGTLLAGSGLFTSTSKAAITSSEGTGVITVTSSPADATLSYKSGKSAASSCAVTAAQLKNADGTYTSTSGNTTETTYNYCANHGLWYTGKCEACESAHECSFTVEQSRIPATCMATGSVTWKCESCDKTETETLPIDSSNHTGNNHTDKAKDATCTEAGYTGDTVCECGVTITYGTTIPALGHTAGADATCTTAQTCTVCGAELTAALGHDWVAGEITKQPTCTAEGEQTYSCSRCSETKTETLEKLQHDYKSVVSAPTCTEAGYTTYTCSACGDTYTGDNVAATGHSYTSEVTTAATCTEKGVKTFTCGTCGHTYTEEIAALGHDYVDHAAQDATCTEKGWNAYQTCSRCDYTTYSEIAALDHDYKAAVTAPTCTEQGFTTYTCSRCNDSYVDNYVDALGHKYNAVVTDPTCDAEGFTTYTCSACGDSYVDNEVSALGHNWGEGTITTKPTCTNAGIMTFTCQNDATHIKNEAVAALGHSWVDADCDTPKTCSVCGETEGAALGHTAGEVVVENNKAATCTAAGSYDNVTRCTVCGAETSRETVTVNALGHTEAEAVVENNVAPDCVNDGSYDSVVKCSVCGEEVRRETIVVPASGHDYDAVVTAPACESAGYTTYTCSICSDSYTADEVAALGHTDGKVVVENEKAATCTATGSYDNVTYCTVCGVETSRETITVDALDHTAEVIPGKDATCTETGLTEGKHCSVCNEVLVAQEVVTALGHTEVTDAAKAPTCTETGLTEGKHCSVCNEVLVAQTVVDALGHTEVIDAAVAATCTETGLTEGKHCSVCGEVIVAQTVVDALGHTEVIDEAVAPDCENAGLTEGKHCSVCGEVTVAQEEVAALGHDYKSEITAPTFEADGYTTYTCSRCGDNYVETHEGTQLIAVAKIGDTKFQTLSEAFEAAEEGDTIELLKNHTVTSSETWDLTGKTLKVPSGIRIIIKGCYLTIEGGTFNIDGAITNYCGLTINNGTFYLKNQSITTDGGGTLLKINGGEFHVSGGGVGIYVRFAVGYIYNGTFTAEEGSTILGMSANNSVLTVSGGSYSQDVTDYLSDGYCCPLRDGMYVVGVHTAAEAVKENEAAATCTATGSYDEVVYCSGCNAELSRNTVTVDALGHTAGEVVVENNVEATCTATGSYDNVTYCTVCDAELSRDTVTVEKLAHTEVAVPGKAATCTETGLTDGAKCSVCGETLTAQEEIPALGHTDGDVAVENEKDATCTAEGSYDNVVYCSVCDEELSRDTVTVDKIAHTVVIDEAVAATCTETGLTEGSHCDVCGEVLVNQEEVAALGHSYNTVVTDPTCTEYGYTTYTCSVCGNSYQDDEVTEFGHDYVAVVTEPTCIKDGYTTYSCSRCEDSYTDDVTTATGVHTYVNGVCSGCGKVELFDLYGSNMTLGNDLSINFFIVKSNLKGTDYYVEIEKFYHNNQDPVKKRIEYSEFDTQGDLWKVTFNGVAAKEMTDNVYVTVYHSDGTPASNKYVTSIRDYAMKVLNSTATVPKVKTVAVDMLNYGAAAQVHFGYNTSDLANNILTDTQKTLATQSVEYSSKYEKGAKYYGTVLSLESNIILNMYHYPITKDMSAVVKYTDYLGVSKLIEIDGSNFYERGDLLGVIVDELVLADGFQVVTCEIYDTNGNLISTTKESVESYVARATASTNADPIYEELIKFVYSARDYFLNK